MTPVAQVLAQVVPVVEKIAAEAKRRAEAAPKPTDPALVEKAAGALISGGWIPEGRKADAVAALGSHAGALDTLCNLAVKSAEELGRRTADPRLAAGQQVDGAQPTQKQAADEGSPADRAFFERMTSRRTRNT